MAFFEKGDVRIHFEEVGSGFPIMIIPGGGLNSNISVLANSAPFDPLKEFGKDYRCIVADLRNAPNGQSVGPLEPERPWDAYADDQIGLMDHLGIRGFIVMGFCIGGPFTWNLLRRAGGRIPAAVMVQPSGSRPDDRNLFYRNNTSGWGATIRAAHPEVSAATVDAFLTRMYRNDPDFVFTVTRDFVRTCETPILVLPDNIPAHPYEVAMEVVALAPHAEVSLYPWKETRETIDQAVSHVRAFLKTHVPAPP